MTISLGTVYWFTGLSGAGKTTLGKWFFQRLKIQNPNTVFLDGDQLRSVLNAENAYAIEDRTKLALQYSKFCRLFSNQGLNVVCCTVSMFDEIRSWNRNNIQSYKEIYIKVPMDELIRRDQKGLYSRTISQNEDSVVGFQSTFEEPKSPDIVLLNDGTVSLQQLQADLTKKLTELDLGNTNG